MKHHFVKTENLKKLLAAAAFMGSGEVCRARSALCMATQALEKAEILVITVLKRGGLSKRTCWSKS